MCGIVGLIVRGAKIISNFEDFAFLATQMTATLNHRGPDHSDVWTSGPVALGHARLSIIDLTLSGNQPMHTIDGRYVIVFNGEVYNFMELRAELEQSGVLFRGRSDTEVVLNAFARWGMAMLPRLNGIFAFAIWDNLEQELTLVRDRFGVKPLYYHQLPGVGLIFGSEIKAILASGLVSRKVSLQALHEFTYFGVSLGSNTMFDGIQRLEPGHWLCLKNDECDIQPYWLADHILPNNDDFETAAEKTGMLLEAAVKRQLVSDVPIGVFLSGGIDSSAITAFASRHYSGIISTYSVGFDFDQGVNELPKARQVARCFGTDHYELHIEGVHLPKVIEDLVRHHDEPFSDAANIPLYLLCQKLNGSLKVVLQGDGGDEIFAGYRRYALLSQLSLWKSLAAVRFLISGFKNDKIQRLYRILDTFGQDEPALRMAMLLTMDTSRASFKWLLSDEWQSCIFETDAFMRYRKIANRFQLLDPVQQMLYCDTTILLPDVFLEKVDKSTMAFGIESRVPFLDNDLTEYVMGLPASVKVHGNNKKRLLKQSLRSVVPDGILDGPKTGFSVPFSHWLRTSLHGYASNVFFAETSRPDSFFDRNRLLSLLKKHKSSPSQNSGFILWKALNLCVWHNTYFK